MKQLPLVITKDGVRYSLIEFDAREEIYTIRYKAYSKKLKVNLDFTFNIQSRKFKEVSSSDFKLMLSAHVNIQALTEGINNFINNMPRIKDRFKEDSV